MPLVKSKGNMYSWCTNMNTHIGGECPHKCVYCYVNNPRFGRPIKYQGKPWLIEKELNVNYGIGRTIFIEHMNDMFAEKVPREWIIAILNHVKKYPYNTYIFQTKNPSRYFDYAIPAGSFLGTTIETNRDTKDISMAPHPLNRIEAMILLKKNDILHFYKRFITVEPIMDFDIDIFYEYIMEIYPDFVNIGADSKGHCLIEPSWEKVQKLIDKLRKAGIEIREKHNLDRLKIMLDKPL